MKAEIERAAGAFDHTRPDAPGQCQRNRHDRRGMTSDCRDRSGPPHRIDQHRDTPDEREDAAHERIERHGSGKCDALNHDRGHRA